MQLIPDCDFQTKTREESLVRNYWGWTVVLVVVLCCVVLTGAGSGVVVVVVWCSVTFWW
jgi:hypothetical protein